ncbi:hypothetical protein LC065_20235 (plasmid) [Halobacillus litoralis]|uniref:hypothetical protein n=1 Tax=Halobacillus litoralis TaxID=45668 RepID=UPI001CFEFC1B|nr:hypothetical protein [Halobacillus litoralis]WLR49575.1 hypothetical protein LC065_20235 [Halobacillus litoralis]
MSLRNKIEELLLYPGLMSFSLQSKLSHLLEVLDWIEEAERYSPEEVAELEELRAKLLDELKGVL